MTTLRPARGGLTADSHAEQRRDGGSAGVVTVSRAYDGHRARHRLPASWAVGAPCGGPTACTGRLGHRQPVRSPSGPTVDSLPRRRTARPHQLTGLAPRSVRRRPRGPRDEVVRGTALAFPSAAGVAPSPSTGSCSVCSPRSHNHDHDQEDRCKPSSQLWRAVESLARNASRGSRTVCGVTPQASRFARSPGTRAAHTASSTES